MENKHILVVEDEQALSNIVINMLEVFGYSGKVCENAGDALETLKDENFGCLILDLTLPDMSGQDLYKMIREKYPQYRGHVIFTSGFNISEELEELIKEDHLDFLAKPFSVDKFKTLIEKN